MANFSDGFLPYIPPDDKRTKDVLRRGVIVVDTNVLLDAYRYTESARNELFAVFRALGRRLWIPHQVALEFHRNRNKVIASHGDAYNEVGKAISAVKALHDEDLARRIREFGNRVALDESTLEELLKLAGWDASGLIERVNTMRAAHGVSDRFLREDPVLQGFQTLFSGCVGERPSPEEEEGAREEARRRIEDGRPPGFKDSGKDDPCGDYLLWHQSLIEAKKRSAPLMLVTRDGKADWFLKVKGKSLGALPDLVAEAFDVSGVDFVAIPTKSFLLQAKAEFGTNVSQATLAQTDAIRDNASRIRHLPILHLERSSVEDLTNRISDLIASTLDEYVGVRKEMIGSAGATRPEVSDVTLGRMDALSERVESLSALRDQLANPAHIHPDAIGIRASRTQRQLIRELERKHDVTYIATSWDNRRLTSTPHLVHAFRTHGPQALDGMTRTELAALANALHPHRNLSATTSKRDLIEFLLTQNAQAEAGSVLALGDDAVTRRSGDGEASEDTARQGTDGRSGQSDDAPDMTTP